MEANTTRLDLNRVRFDPSCVMYVTAAYALDRMAIPICQADGCLHIASANLQDTRARDELNRATGLPVKVYATDPEAIKWAVMRFFGTEKGGGTDDDSSEAALLVDRLLRNACLRHASDIHFDPEETYTRVRFRTDGVLEDAMRFPAELHPSVASRVKIMADLDIADRREPQDGAFTWQIPDEISKQPGTFLDVRAASLPVAWGERLTLRLLEKDTRKFSLEKLGMAPEDLRSFKRAISLPNGLILFTGPTGSGKSTSLYAAINHLLDLRPLNIVTVEDPIEYRIEGVVQAQTDEADKVSFTKALRSILRHDPDVVMIGEIRDTESLDVAVKAALTGHLVLSTLHTNDAVNAVTRLSDMKLERHLAAATLRLVVAQRLVRALCPHCHEAYEITQEESYALGHSELVGEVAYRAHGCLACAGRGLNGRLGVFEMFAPNRHCLSLIAQGAPESELRDAAQADGMRSLTDDAIEKCLAGMTTIDEVLRAVGGSF